MLGGQNGEEGKEVEDQVSGEEDGAQDRQEKEGEEVTPRRCERLRTLEGSLALVGGCLAERHAPRTPRRVESTTEGVGEVGDQSPQVPLSNRLASRCHAFARRRAVPDVHARTRSQQARRNDPARTGTAHAVLRRLQSPSLRSAQVFEPFADALGKPNGTVPAGAGASIPCGASIAC
jgi:hypothetical protein